jgi:hypothetical protein
MSDILLDRGGGAIDLTGLTVKLAVDDVDGVNVVAATTTGVSIQPTNSVTVDATNGEWKAINHGLKQGDEVILATSDVLPAGFATATRYFVRDATPHRFKLSYKPNTVAIALTDAGSGSHTYYVVGHVTRAWQTGELPAVTADGEDHRAYWTVTDGSSLVSTHPANGYRPVRVLAAP